MLRSKSKEDIERHAEVILRKAKNDAERKSRCFCIAQMFCDIREYKLVVSYVKDYLTVRPDSSSAYKLLGQAYEELGEIEDALLAYENCFKYDDSQHQLLLKICELYCDPKINLNREKVNKVLKTTKKYFPYHSIVENLRYRLMNVEKDGNKEEYEVMLMAESELKPDNCRVRINLINLYLQTDRIELAYRSCCEIENSRLFCWDAKWYECFDNVFNSYYKTFKSKCNTDFYVSWLHCLDSLCSLTYNESFEPVLKLDRLLNLCHGEDNSEDYKRIVDHFTAQLSFHIGMLLIVKAKGKADCLTEILKNQVWFEHKTKIGALLLASVKEKFPPAESSFNRSKDIGFHLSEKRIHQSKARYVEVFYTLQSLAKNNNQGEKMFVDCIKYYISGNWRNDVYKTFECCQLYDESQSFFVKSDYFKDIVLRMPSGNDIHFLFCSFEAAYDSNLHNMIWLGLRTLIDMDKPTSTRIHPKLCLTAFKSLHLTGGVNNSNVESLNQLDMDSFLYLNVLCRANEMRINRPPVLPSCVTTRLHGEKEEQFWKNARALARDLVKEKEAKWSSVKDLEVLEVVRVNMIFVLEQIRATSLQLPLVVLLARSFAHRAEIESPAVADACEKKALHLWNIVLINCKLPFENTKPFLHPKDPFFNYDVSNYSPSEMKTICDEARMYLGTHYFKSGLYNQALETLSSVQTPESLFKQAQVHEAISHKELSDLNSTGVLKARQFATLNQSRDCLVLAHEMVQTSDRNQALAQNIKDKLRSLSKILDNGDGYNGVSRRHSTELSDQNDTFVMPSGLFGGAMEVSTPKKRSQGIGSLGSDGIPCGHLYAASDTSKTPLTHHQNQIELQSLQESIRVISESVKNLKSTPTRFDALEGSVNRFEVTFNRLEARFERLEGRFDRLEVRFDRFENSLKSYFTDLKKELKQKPDLYNVLEDDDYNPEDVLNSYPSYFQRNADLMQGGAAVSYPAAAPPIPAAYFSPKPFQGNVPFYGQTVPSAEDSMTEFLRTMASQRANALGDLPVNAGIPALQPTLVPTANLAHIQIPGSSSPSTNPQNQPTAPNNGQTGPLPGQSLTEYVMMEFKQRANASGGLLVNACIPGLPPTLVPTANLAHVQIPGSSSPGTNPQNQPTAPNNGQTGPLPGQSLTDYVMMGAKQRANAPGGLLVNTGIPGLPPTLVPTANLAHVQIPSSSSPGTNPQNQPMAPNNGQTGPLPGQSLTDYVMMGAKQRANAPGGLLVNTGIPGLQPTLVPSANLAHVQIPSTKPQNQATAPNNVVINGQTGPLPGQSLTEFVIMAAQQRANALGGLPVNAGIPGLHQPTLVPTANLAHVQIPSTLSPSSTKPQNQPTAPNNVVITTSDSLPTTVPTTAPTLFVNIPPEHRLGSGPVVPTPAATVIPPTAPHKFQIPMPSNFKLVEKAPVADPADDKDIEVIVIVSKEKEGEITHLEHDPLPNFKPIIPLPDEVEVKTGEEDETVIFDSRAKLYRFVDKEWKERGLGQLKILKSEGVKPRYRILMRREQVHKVCANHFITSDMNLVKSSGHDKAYIWWAHDFADEKMEVEKLLVKFKTVDDGKTFKEKFDEAKKCSDSSQVVKTVASKANVLNPAKLVLGDSSQNADTDKITLGGFTFSSQPKITDVPKEQVEEKETEDKKNVSPFAAFSFSPEKTDEKSGRAFSFGVKSNAGDLSSLKTETKAVTDEVNPLEFLITHWECSTCYTRNPPESIKCMACEAPAPTSVVQTPEKTKPTTAPSDRAETVSAQPSLSSLFKPPQGSWNCDMCFVQNKAEVTSCAACGTVKPGCTAAAKPAETTAFTFGIPSDTVVASTTSTSVAEAPVFGHNLVADVSNNQPAFGGSSNTGSIFTFGMPTDHPSSNFSFGGVKFNFTMNSSNKNDETKSPQVAPKSAHKSDGDDSDNEHDEDHDHTEGIYFQPVIDLPDKVEVKTGEEDETVLYSQRSKLFRFDSDSKEWKERGVGDVKILKHDTTQKIRLLMRREPIMKLCLNHYLTPELEVKAKDPKSWMWCAPDFSDGQQVLEKFCMRFKTPDIAQEFKRKLDSIKSGAESASSENTEDSDDVVFVSQTPVVSDELRDKALRLKLPENFYRYLDLPDCRGCRGCRQDPEDQLIKITKPKESVLKTPVFGQNLSSQTPIFGSKPFFGSASNPVLTAPTDSVKVGAPAPSSGILTSTNIETESTDKVNPFSYTPPSTVAPSAPETTKSQLSTFSFALPQSGPSATTVFSFSPQNSVFGGSPSVFSQNTNLPIFGSKNANDSGDGKVNSSLVAVQASQPLFFGNTSSPEVLISGSNDGAAEVNKSQSCTSNAESQSTNQNQTPLFGSRIDQSQTATPVFGAKGALGQNLSSGFAVTSDAQSAALTIGSETSTTPVEQSSPDTTVETDLPLFNKEGALSFESLANKSGSINAFAGDNTNFQWEGAGSQIFRGKKTETVKPAATDRSEDRNETQDNEEHDPYFEPIVPLPDKIELKTGEEDEDIVFSERSKLYRMDDSVKEWKERGVGLMKILHHRQYNTYRLLMRREQVHKIVCNHLITPDMTLSPLMSSETSFCWGAMNMSQDDTEPSKEMLCIKFKNKELAVKFKSCFETAKNYSPTK